MLAETLGCDVPCTVLAKTMIATRSYAKISCCGAKLWRTRTSSPT